MNIMKQFKYLIILVIMMGGCTNVSSNDEDVKSKIIALEREALELWNNGNPDGFLNLSADDVTYIDPLLEQKMEGKEALRKYYDNVRGQVNVDFYEMITPLVQLTRDAAVLSYNLVSKAGDNVYKWNCTEVFRKDAQGNWKIIHTHWSLVQPKQ